MNVSVCDRPAMGPEDGEGQHNEDEGDDESQGHDERVKLCRSHRRKHGKNMFRSHLHSREHVTCLCFA